MHPTTSEHEAPAASAVTPHKLIRLPQVMEMTGRGRTATLDDVRAGRFPKPIKVGSATLWLESEVQGWIADRVRQSRGGAGGAPCAQQHRHAEGAA